MPRKYAKRDPQFPVDESAGPAAEQTEEPKPTPPAAPDPAVMALKEDLVKLIRSRSQARQDVENANASMVAAQNVYQVAQGHLNGIEQEVQYLHQQIAQLEGRTPQPAPIQFPTPNPQSNVFPGVSSVPTDPNDMVNRAHASRAAI